MQFLNTQTVEIAIYQAKECLFLSLSKGTGILMTRNSRLPMVSEYCNFTKPNFHILDAETAGRKHLLILNPIGKSSLK